MGISYGYHQDGRFIEDIHPAEEGDGFDVRQPRVKYQAIGALDERYLRSRNFFAHATADDAVVIPVRVRLGYTHVPPLAILDTPFQPLRRGGIFLTHARFYLWHAWMEARHATQWAALHLGEAWQSIQRIFAAGFVGAAAFATGIGQALYFPGRHWLPKKYSVVRGLYTDWSTPVLAWLRWAILPLAVAVSLIFLLVMPLQRSTTHNPSGITSTQKRHRQAAPSTASPTHQGSTSTGTAANRSGTNGQPSANNTPAASTGTASTAVDPPAATQNIGDPVGSVLAPITGSTGSGSSGSSSGSSSSGSALPPSSSGSSSSGPIPNTTVTVPPVSATVGGKQLVNTSGTSLTLN